MRSLPRRGLTAALLVAAVCLAPAVVRADIVIHDGGVTKDRDAVERVEARTGNRPTLVLSSDVLSGPSRQLTRDVQVERCEGDPVSLDVPARTEEIVEFVLSFELDKAMDGLRLIQTLLPCSEAPVAARDLARLAFLVGAVRFDQGDEEAAAAAMAEAVAQDATYEGERGFPKAHEDLLAAAKAAVSEDLPRLFAWLGPSMNEAFLDGVKIEFPGQEGVVIGAGRHLLQYWTPHGLKGAWVQVSDEDGIILWPGSGRALWADGGRSPGGRLGMRLALQEEFGGREGDVHVLHYRGRRAAGATYPSDGSERVSWKGPPPDRTAGGDDPPKGGDDEPPKGGDDEPPKGGDDGPPPDRRPARQQTDPEQADGKLRRFRVAVTFGYQFNEPFSYAMLGVDFHAVLIGPLQVGAFLRPSYGGQADFPVPEGDDPVSGPVFFLPFGLHVGVRKDGWLSPWVGGAFQYAYNRDGLRAAPSLIGFAAQGGLDISPNDSPLVLRVTGEVGLLGLHFNARIHGGVGVRF